ncbi:hypothetical protein KFK09_012766 [Dendrobium nobile]|uniref:Uncharacterized protein n=1 Tax=Dendrobium nobile TaxID=94219 RepID=A0A8T3BIN6_DENNO|nr:hypothetical protein KFK09_012766 [Dendrobium nobile]
MIYAGFEQAGFEQPVNLTAEYILRFPLFAVNLGFTHSWSSTDLRDLAEEARERAKDKVTFAASKLPSLLPIGELSRQEGTSSK